MKTQYFLMLSGSYRDQTKRLVCLLNLGMLGSFSLVTHPRADNINVASQRRAAYKASQVTDAQAGISSGMESLFEVEAAYWCAVNNALNKYTPSA
jgi:hypothetical protein